jgi:hypothetical protein
MKLKKTALQIFTVAITFLALSSYLITVQASESTVALAINSTGRINHLLANIALKRYCILTASEGTPSEISQLFDMSQSGSYTRDKIQQIHALRPDFKALLYRTTHSIYNYSDEWQFALDNNWILKDSEGNLVYSTQYPENYFADIGNPQYQKWVASWIRNTTVECGFDGVFADGSVVAQASEYFFQPSTAPVNPRTGESWTDEEIRQAIVQLHGEIKDAIGSKLLVGNGVWQGVSFWTRQAGYTQILLDSKLDGFMSEGIWYQNSSSWMTENAWLDSVNFFIWVQDNFLKDHPERFFVPYCKLAGLPSGVSIDQMAKYAFASTLLCVKTNQVYLGLISDMAFTAQTIQPLFDVEIGAPTNDYYMVDGTHVYSRDFSNVKVLVNPTPYSYTIDLHGTYQTLEGQLVSTITIENHSGAILKIP